MFSESITWKKPSSTSVPPERVEKKTWNAGDSCAIETGTQFFGLWKKHRARKKSNRVKKMARKGLVHGFVLSFQYFVDLPQVHTSLRFWYSWVSMSQSRRAASIKVALIPPRPLTVPSPPVDSVFHCAVFMRDQKSISPKPKNRKIMPGSKTNRRFEHTKEEK